MEIGTREGVWPHLAASNDISWWAHVQAETQAINLRWQHGEEGQCQHWFAFSEAGGSWFQDMNDKQARRTMRNGAIYCKQRKGNCALSGHF